MSRRSAAGRSHREARSLDGRALPHRRGGVGRGRGGARGPGAARREGAVRGRLGGHRLRVRPRAPADRQGLQRIGTYGLTVVVHAPDKAVSDPAFARVLRRVEGRLKSDPAVTTVVAPRAGVSISRRSPCCRDLGRRGARRERHGPRRRAAEGPARKAGVRRRAGRPHRRARHVVRLQSGQQVGDDEVRADLLAGHARDPRARVRLPGRRGAAADADDRRIGRRGGLTVDRDADRRDLDLVDELRADVRAGAGDRLRAVRRLPLPRARTSARSCPPRTRSRRRWTPPARPSCSRA